MIVDTQRRGGRMTIRRRTRNNKIEKHKKKNKQKEKTEKKHEYNEEG